MSGVQRGLSTNERFADEAIAFPLSIHLLQRGNDPFMLHVNDSYQDTLQRLRL